MPLNSNQVKTRKPGAYADGGGLYLHVRDNGDRVWAFRFTSLDGKRTVMEFAKVDDLGLSDARDQARGYRVGLKRDGIDPRHKKKLAAADGMTFKAYWEEKAPGWCVGKDDDESKAWGRSLRDLPGLHALALHEINAAHISAALEKFWYEKPITANRTRERIEKILDAAKVEQYRTGDNPAAWRGNLKFVLPSARKLNKKKGRPSVPYSKAPALMVGLREDFGRAARCVETGILTVTRSQEIRLMEWEEIDATAKTWLIPAEKMKIKEDGAQKPKDHLVPLTDRAIEIIESMPRLGRYVFPSDHADQHRPFRPILPDEKQRPPTANRRPSEP